MIVLGLTGSIGMGKTTTAAMFAALGVPVNDADQVVHDLYSGEAVETIEAAFPGATIEGKVDRQRLSKLLAQDPNGFSTLESIVHPLVRAREQRFLRHHADAALVVLDIPLLYETDAEKRVDAVAVVTARPEIQRKRVLARPGMTSEKFEMIRSRQMPDTEKRARADFVIDTDHGLEVARRRVEEIVEELTTGASAR